jgi:hypothetical protein
MLNLSIICVANPDKITKVSVNECLKLSELKKILSQDFEPGMRLIYRGKLLEDNEILGRIIVSEEAHIHLVGKLKYVKEDKKDDQPKANIRKKQEITKVPNGVEENSLSQLELFNGALSPVPIAPHVVNIDGILYTVQTGPPQVSSLVYGTIDFAVLNSLTHTNATAPPAPQVLPVPQQRRPRILERRIFLNMNLFWLTLKLSFALYILTRGASWPRTIFLGFLAGLIILFQTNAITIPTIHRQRGNI